jgi:hypothetical protein
MALYGWLDRASQSEIPAQASASAQRGISSGIASGPSPVRGEEPRRAPVEGPERAPSRATWMAAMVVAISPTYVTEYITSARRRRRQAPRGKSHHGMAGASAFASAGVAQAASSWSAPQPLPRTVRTLHPLAVRPRRFCRWWAEPSEAHAISFLR